MALASRWSPPMPEPLDGSTERTRDPLYVSLRRIGLAWAEAASGVLPLGKSPQLSESLMRNAREDKDIMALAARKAWHNRIHLNALRRNRENSVAVLDLIRVALDE